MNQTDQVAALENTIFERAQALADEHMEQAQRARERIHEDSLDRLRLLEEKEVLSARNRAEREYRRLVQASEIRMQAELDRERWELVEGVMEQVSARLSDLHAKRELYLELFEQLLTQSAELIERAELVAQVNKQDYRELHEKWGEIAARAAPNKRVLLHKECIDCTGGVLVRSEDNRIHVDNTFEGRLERMSDELYRQILERLFPTAMKINEGFHG